MRDVKSYHTTSLKNTREFHVDSPHVKAYKGMLYLTDVKEESGPYCFVEGTARFCLHRYTNMIYNLFKGYLLTDMRIHNKKKIRKFIAPKGTLILSTQDGIHRGWPQEEGENRIVLVYNFIDKRKIKEPAMMRN